MKTEPTQSKPKTLNRRRGGAAVRVQPLVRRLLEASAFATEQQRPEDAELLETAACELRRLSLLVSCVDGDMMLMAAFEAMSGSESSAERSKFTSALYQRLKNAEQDSRDHETLAESA